MQMRQRLQQLALAAARRPALTLGIVAALALGGAVVALGMKPDAGSDTFVSRSAQSFKATQDDHQHFGGDAVVVLIRESLPDLVETKDLATVSQLEACLGGQTLIANASLGSFTPAPGAERPYGGWNSPCGRLRKLNAVQVVYGPGTFLNRAVAAVNSQIEAMISSANGTISRYAQAAYQLALARHLSRSQAQAAAKDAAQLAYQQQLQQLEQMAVGSGLTGVPRIDDPQFIPEIVFDQTRGTNQPKARFAYLFPTAGSALIQARLKPSLSSGQQAQAISLIRRAVKMRMFRLAYGGTYTVTGVPVVLSDLASTITGSIALLLGVALGVMAITLLVVFRSSLRLLPLAIAVSAAGITFGVTSLLGGTLTMASIAVLPILIGLGVDYAIQLQSRVQEIRRGVGGASSTDGTIASPARGTEPAVAAARLTSTDRAIAGAALAAAPTIGTAVLATATGFLVLQLSPVPMVRGFGVLLVVGIAVAFACALMVVSAALSADHDGGLVAAWLRGAAEILADSAAVLSRPLRAPARRALVGRSVARAAGPARGALSAAIRHPGRVLALAGLLAVLGWVADTQTTVQSDVTKLVPTSMPALRNLRTLERVTGVSGEIDVVVHARNVASPQTIGWMLSYQDRLLSHYGYLETKGCSHATLCPALSLPDLFCSGVQSQRACGALSQSEINGLLSAVPAYFSQAVITGDRREATLAFGIRLMPLARQQKVIGYMRSQLRPPPGVSAALAGLPVLAAQADADLSSSARRLLTLLAGLIAVGLVLLAIFRDVERALVPMIPIALATGWSALIVFLIGIPLNPMSAALGTLVIAISTEFSVLLSERFRRERSTGRGVKESLERAYGSTGAAVMASGITAIFGFGVLIVSNITMLRDFGLVTLVDLSVALAGVLLVLPAALTLSERGELVGSLRDVAGWTGAIPRLRRRTRVA